MRSLVQYQLSLIDYFLLPLHLHFVVMRLKANNTQALVNKVLLFNPVLPHTGCS
jgi:hypothetical protein